MQKLRKQEINQLVLNNFQERGTITLCFTSTTDLTLEGKRGRGSNCPPLSIVLGLNFCSLTDYQKHWYNCSLVSNTSFDANQVTSIDDVIIIRRVTCELTRKVQLFAKK